MGGRAERRQMEREVAVDVTAKEEVEEAMEVVEVEVEVAAVAVAEVEAEAAVKEEVELEAGGRSGRRHVFVISSCSDLSSACWRSSSFSFL